MTSESVLSFFKEITRIPRESGHEGPMGDYLMAFAAARGLEAKRDKAGNVLIAKPASAGREDVPTLVLFAVVPFNLLKGVIVSALTFLLYKRISPLLHKGDEKKQKRRAQTAE